MALATVARGSWSFSREGEERGQHRRFGVDLEEAPQVVAGLAPAEAVGAESQESAGNPGGDLVRDEPDVVRDGDEGAAFAGEDRFEVRSAGRFGGMQHVPAAALEGVGAEEFVAAALQTSAETP